MLGLGLGLDERVLFDESAVTFGDIPDSMGSREISDSERDTFISLLEQGT